MAQGKLMGLMPDINKIIEAFHEPMTKMSDLLHEVLKELKEANEHLRALKDKEDKLDG
jgi:hypothetical protein